MSATEIPRSPPRERDADPFYPPERSSFFDGRLIVSAGEVLWEEPYEVHQPIRPGLTVAVTLSGKMTCHIDDRDPIVVERPTASLIMARGPHRRRQVFAAGERIRYLLVHVDPSLVAELFELDFDRLVSSCERAARHPEPVFLTRAIDNPVETIAAKVLSCPVDGPARPLFRLGKALELASLVLEHVLPSGTRRGVATTLREEKRVEEACALLAANFRDPPDLTSLSRRLGLNERKLTQGFRRRFGCTVHAWLQETRLKHAHRMLASGDMSVSEVAFQVGYAPAHFATLFKKRFGVSPSGLR